MVNWVKFTSRLVLVHALYYFVLAFWWNKCLLNWIELLLVHLYLLLLLLVTPYALAISQRKSSYSICNQRNSRIDRSINNIYRNDQCLNLLISSFILRVWLLGLADKRVERLWHGVYHDLGPYLVGMWISGIALLSNNRHFDTETNWAPPISHIASNVYNSWHFGICLNSRVHKAKNPEITT